MTTVLRVRIKTNWVNGWFLRLFTKPVVLVDRVEYPGQWSKVTEIETIDESSTRVAVGFRYFGRGSVLGPSESVLTHNTDAGTDSVDMVFKNGPLNHQPFRLVKRT